MTFVGDSPCPPPYMSSTNRRHQEYYFEDGNLVIQIHETLFKVWDSTFHRHSEFLEKEVSSREDKKNGLDEEHPLILKDVQSIDFERLLWIIYPPVFGEYKAKTAPEWISILALSTRWKFEDIRALSIKKLGKLELDPVEKIELMLKYEIEKTWAFTSFVALCSRPHALTVTEGRRLGIEVTVNIASAREKLEKGGRKKPDEVKKALLEVF